MDNVSETSEGKVSKSKKGKRDINNNDKETQTDSQVTEDSDDSSDESDREMPLESDTSGDDSDDSDESDDDKTDNDSCIHYESSDEEESDSDEDNKEEEIKKQTSDIESVSSEEQNQTEKPVVQVQGRPKMLAVGTQCDIKPDIKRQEEIQGDISPISEIQQKSAPEKEMVSKEVSVNICDPKKETVSKGVSVNICDLERDIPNSKDIEHSSEDQNQPKEPVIHVQGRPEVIATGTQCDIEPDTRQEDIQRVISPIPEIQLRRPYEKEPRRDLPEKETVSKGVSVNIYELERDIRNVGIQSKVKRHRKDTQTDYVKEINRIPIIVDEKNFEKSLSQKAVVRLINKKQQTTVVHSDDKEQQTPAVDVVDEEQQTSCINVVDTQPQSLGKKRKKTRRKKRGKQYPYRSIHGGGHSVSLAQYKMLQNYRFSEIPPPARPFSAVQKTKRAVSQYHVRFQ